jgi:tetratricopeptide (TPR) repeat protein
MMTEPRKYDFNQLERSAAKLMELGRYSDALKIYFFMADGDNSLDAGWLGMKMGECYEGLGDPHAARYWYGRAVEENPEVRLSSKAAYERLGYISFDDVLISD